MFEHFFDRLSKIQSLRDGPGGSFFEGFATELHQNGYSKITIRRHIRAGEQFLSWIIQIGKPLSCLSEKIIERYDQHLDQCLSFSNGHQLQLLNGARLFLKYLRDTGTITTPIIDSTAQDPDLLTEFYEWMRQHRGTSDLTLYNYSLSIRELLKRFGEDPTRFNAKDLRQFVLEKSDQSGWAAAKKCTTALRMFLRFLITEGKCSDGLDGAIPVLAHWRLSSLPQYVQPEEVEHIIDSCDLKSPVGKRNRAILLLLARLGLRAGDILDLRLSDIDWEGAWIYVSGKGHCQDRLPLTQEVGNGIVDYLQDGRPQTDTDVVFVRARAPFRAFGSHCAISVIVAQAMRRAGVTCQSRGAAHVLRHSVATSMLRKGVSLQDIAAILRHRSIETTEIYAKVDTTTLKQIAQPWPEVEIC
jgi:site-specific recombinase XerD